MSKCYWKAYAFCAKIGFFSLRLVLNLFLFFHQISGSCSCKITLRILHHKETRENNKNLLLPKVRTEAGRKSFLFQGSKLYNKLPDALKQEQSIMNFMGQCDQLESEFNF